MSLGIGEALAAQTDYITRMKARAEHRQTDAQFAVALFRKTVDALTEGGTKDLASAPDDDKQNLREAHKAIASDYIGVQPEVISCLFESETLLSVEQVRRPTDVATDIATFFETPLGQRFMTLQPEDRQKMITQVGTDFD